jgi:release factor glutamine methyltransferase
MVRIDQRLHAAADALAAVTEEPRLEAEILLVQVLGKSRTWLRAWPEKPVEAAQEQQYQALLARRLAGEPIAYILGAREFWSREFLVTPAVLIPRPDTELLVELALALLPQSQPARVADLGTGSGAIAVSIALERPQVQVIAADFSTEALAVARSNAQRLGAANVQCCLSDWLDGLPPQPFDLILSNPPYIAENDPHLQQGDLRFEPASALVSGPDGLDDLRRIAAAARSRLLPGGWLLLEHGYDQAAAVRHCLHTLGYLKVASHRDLAGQERTTLGQTPA